MSSSNRHIDSHSRHSSHRIEISHSDLVTAQTVAQYYVVASVQKVLHTTLDFINTKRQQGVILPYYAALADDVWLQKPKALSIYLTDRVEGQKLNREARDKDYATNVLSYPSDLPSFLLNEMPVIDLGELVICHEVVVREAEEQSKTVGDHGTHLLVHGILHLLGFDHELGMNEQQEMEQFEIAILATFGIADPYL